MDARVRIKFETTVGGMKSHRARHRVAMEDCNARDRMRSYEISQDRMRSEATAPDRTLPILYRTLPHSTALYRTLPHATAPDRTGPHGTARDRTGPHGTANDRKVLTLDISLQSLDPRNTVTAVEPPETSNPRSQHGCGGCSWHNDVREKKEISAASA